MKLPISTAAALLLALGSHAFAEEGTQGADPARAGTGDAGQAVTPGIVQGSGVKVGEGSTFYPVLGVETGFISNVFFTESDPTAAGLLRILGQIGFGSLSQQRLNAASVPEATPLSPLPNHGGLSYRADIYAAWDQYLSTDDDVQAQGGLSGGVMLTGVANPNKPFSIAFLEHLQRVTRATNFESTQRTNRDINNLTIRFNYQPTGRTVGGYLYYEHALDFFEDKDQRFANRMNHTFGVRAQWQWLPLTRLFADVSIGVFGGIGSISTKQSSYPLTAVVGTQTMLSEKLTMSGRVGYANGFYAAGPSYSSVTGGVQFGFRYSPLGRVLAGYNYDQQDSINANFFTDHGVMLSLEQQFVPFLAFVRSEFHVRTYQGVTTVVPDIMAEDTRSDVIVRVAAGLRYNWRDWIASTVEYAFTTDQTDFRYTFGTMPDDPSFTRHELLLGVRGAF